MSQLKRTELDKLLERTRIGLRTHRAWITSLLITFLVGSLSRSRMFSDPSVQTIPDAIRNSVDLRPANICMWLVILILIALPFFEWLLAIHHRKKGYEAVLARNIASRVDPSISPFSKGIISWGDNLTLQLAPDLRFGWRLRDVKIQYAGDEFAMPSDLILHYQRYFENNKEKKRLFNDGDKFMLVKNPTSFSDATDLVLELRKTKYSKLLFYRENVATIPENRTALLKKAIHELSIEFVNSLCLHTVVITSDDKVLLTQAASKKEFGTGAWSVSVEEQLSPEDLKDPSAPVVEKWGKRQLFEELGVTEDQYQSDNFRLLSVFIEGCALNCSLAAVVRLDLTHDQLTNILKTRPKTDTEFTDWKFDSWSELAEQLLNPNEHYHPTSGYRSFLALVKRWGYPSLEQKLRDG